MHKICNQNREERRSTAEPKTVRLFINGRWCQPPQPEYSEVSNPATGEIIAKVVAARIQDVNDAVESACAAFPKWSKTAPRERAKLLRRTADVLERRQEEIARVLTMEHGKPLKDSYGEISWSVSILRFYAEESTRIFGEVLQCDNTHRRSLVAKQPVGVVAAIAPWNFPVDLLVWKIAPALAAGCTVVSKPASYTPVSPGMLVECFAEAGLPPGVLNFITGPGPTVGNALAGHPNIAKVAFTGSTEVGLEIAGQAAKHLARVTLELGGHAPLIVLDDADIDKAVKDGLRRSFSHTGQICHSINIILLSEEIADEFTSKFADATRYLVVADGLGNPNADMGPLTTQSGLKTVERHMDDAVKKGAKILTGGRRMTQPPFDRGLFFEPTVIDGVTPDMMVFSEETFGPIAPICRFKTVEEAISLANATRYGLVAYVYTRDLSLAFTVAEALQAGSVGVNNCSVVQINAPYGGFKMSGLGTELSHHGIEAYLLMKHIAFDLS